MQNNELAMQQLIQRPVTGNLMAVTAALAFLLLSCAWPIASHAQLSVLYNFGENVGDPLDPSVYGFIAQGRDGSLYSTSQLGGTDSCGAVFTISPGGVFRTVYSFTGGNDGCGPMGGLALGTDGNFYGTTTGGGSFSAPPTLFKVTSAGAVTILHTFSLSTDTVQSSPVLGRNGAFYGTVYSSHSDFGSFYRVTSTGQFTTLYHFDGTHGAGPGPIIQGADGNFYGITYGGGTNGTGAAYRISPAGKIKVIHNFSITAGLPNGALVQASDGNFYGMESGNGNGAIFRLTPTGQFTVLHNFKTSDGIPPWGLVQASDGNLYGVTAAGGQSNTCNGQGCGTIFKMTLAGNFSVVQYFDGTDGSAAQVPAFQNTNGILYGDTSAGGSGGPACNGFCGVFYALNQNLAAFTTPLPYAAKVNQTIEFLGQSFTGTTAVSFNGTGANFKVVSDTYLTTTVPAGAQTGFVEITTPQGVLTSNNSFLVTPQIKTFNPTSGPVGTPVTITGVSLTQTTKVTFGGVAATTVTVNSDTQVTANVPTGAKTGKIGITTAGGTATSSGVFAVTQ